MSLGKVYFSLGNLLILSALSSAIQKLVFWAAKGGLLVAET